MFIFTLDFNSFNTGEGTSIFLTKRSASHAGTVTVFVTSVLLFTAVVYFPLIRLKLPGILKVYGVSEAFRSTVPYSN